MLNELVIHPNYFTDMILEGGYSEDYNAIFVSKNIELLRDVGLIVPAFTDDVNVNVDAIIIHQLQQQHPQFIPTLILYAESTLKDYVQNAKNKPLGFRVGMLARFGWQWHKLDYLPLILQMPATHEMDKYTTLVEHIAPNVTHKQHDEITERLHNMLGFLKVVQGQEPSCFNCLQSVAEQAQMVSSNSVEAASVQLPKGDAASVPLGDKENVEPHNPEPK